MLKEQSIFILQFKENGETIPTEYIFGTIGAIYEQYGVDTIGAVIGTVYNATSQTGLFDGKKAVIRKEKMKVLRRARL